MVFGIITLALAAAAALSAVTYLVLKWDTIRSWFQGRITPVDKAEKSKCEFLVKEVLRNGGYEVIQGVFNTETESIDDITKYKSDSLDNRVNDCFIDKPISVSF